MGLVEGFAIEKIVENIKEKTITKKEKGDINLPNFKILPSISGFSSGPTGIGHLMGIAITFIALYFYFRCNWTIKGKFSLNASNLSDKILGFLVSCCCSICYIAYHLAVPC